MMKGPFHGMDQKASNMGEEALTALELADHDLDEHMRKARGRPPDACRRKQRNGLQAPSATATAQESLGTGQGGLRGGGKV